jgi:hypothetical protein
LRATCVVISTHHLHDDGQQCSNDDSAKQIALPQCNALRSFRSMSWNNPNDHTTTFGLLLHHAKTLRLTTSQHFLLLLRDMRHRSSSCVFVWPEKKQMLCCMSTSIATTFHAHKPQCEQHNSTFEPLQWSNIWSYLGDWQATSNTNCQKAARQGCLNGNEKPHTTTRNYFVRASDWLPHRQN